ncbi:hypothetical protein [Vibrio sp. 10N.261.51.F12]|uniref:hypothetical protein n=1 Tax=Vibrio sp. 10N.261.51.F12 TaxID=3229679 RepID=UPI00354D4770
MKYLVYRWKQRSAIILIISLIICAVMWTLELSTWAGTINNAAADLAPEEGKRNLSGFAIFGVSFVKLTVLTMVPAFLCIGVIKLFAFFFKKRTRDNQNKPTRPAH